MLFVLLMVGCANDPLGALGLSPEIAPLPEEPAAPAEPAALQIPATPPMPGEDIADGGLKEGAPVAGAAAGAGAGAEGAPPPVKFDPISVPLGPREGSVKWQGVSKRGEGRVIDLGNGEFADPGLGN